MKDVRIEKMNVVVDGKTLWAIIDDYGYTMFQIFSITKPIHLLDVYKEKELA